MPYVKPLQKVSNTLQSEAAAFLDSRERQIVWPLFVRSVHGEHGDDAKVHAITASTSNHSPHDQAGQIRCCTAEGRTGHENGDSDDVQPFGVEDAVQLTERKRKSQSTYRISGLDSVWLLY